MSAKRWIESVLLQFPLRVGLGGVFCLAAWTKMGDLQSFAEAIKGFKILDARTHEHLIITAAFTMPWVEMIAGAMLILGLWTRASATVIALMLIMFMGALLHVIFNDVPADCSCFGDLSLVCPATVGWCQVIRDVVLLVPAGYLMWRGGGNLALDTLCERKCGIRTEQEGSPEVDDEGFRG